MATQKLKIWDGTQFKTLVDSEELTTQIKNKQEAIKYGTEVPKTLSEGEVFLLVKESSE